MITSDTQAARRKELYELLGDLPPKDYQISGRKLSERETASYVLETLALDLNGVEPVPAYFVKPKNLSGRAPTVLYNHAHGGDYEIGKEEFIGSRRELQPVPYAEALTRQGCCGLCIDAWNFGERRGRTESALFKEMLWKGRVLWGMMVYDSIKAIDYLGIRSEVDMTRLATMGLSMGSTMAWWLAAIDTRIKVCVDMCCLTDFESLIETQGLDGHGIYYYVPGLLKHFSTAEINALIAPRAHLCLAGNYDALTPSKGLEKIDVALKEVYSAMGAGDKWKLVRYETGHFESAAMRMEVLTFLKQVKREIRVSSEWR